MICSLRTKYSIACSRLTSQHGRNTLLSVIQAFVSLFGSFLAYRIFIQEIGVENLGLWAILLAGTSAARFFDVSGSGGLGRFVAERQSENDLEGTVEYIHTILCATVLINGLAALLIYIFSEYLINLFVEPKWANEVVELLPITLMASLVLPAVSSTICSALDGFQRAELRAYCNILATLVFLIVSLFAIPLFGIAGYALAIIVQQIVLIVLAWFTLRILISKIGWLPSRLTRLAIKNSFSFGAKIQINALMSILSEPLAKIVLGWSGGLLILGYYELASRLVFQVKGIFVAGMQPLMPAIAAMGNNKDRRKTILVQAMSITISISILLFVMLVIISPIFSFLLLNKFDPQLLTMVVVLALGSSINMLSVPIYFAAMAQGIMRWNIVSQAGVAVCVSLAAFFLHDSMEGNGAIIGIFFGLVLGGAICYFGNLNALKIYSDLKILNSRLLNVVFLILILSVVCVYCVRQILLI